MTYVGEAHHGWMLARLVYSLQLGTDDALPSKEGRGSIFDAQELLPEAVWESAARLSWVILPLFSRARVLGFAMVELTTHNGADYEALRIHLSTALANALFSADLPPPSSANAAADPPFASAPAPGPATARRR